jgi:hypothetical protein
MSLWIICDSTKNSIVDDYRQPTLSINASDDEIENTAQLNSQLNICVFCVQRTSIFAWHTIATIHVIYRASMGQSVCPYARMLRQS